MSSPPTPAAVEILDSEHGQVVRINGGDPIPLHPAAEVVVLPGEPGGPRYVSLALAVDQLVVGKARPSVATPEGRAARVWGGGNAPDPRLPLREALRG